MSAEIKRLNHSGVAPTTGLASPITAASSSCTLMLGTGYPTANFVLKIDGGTGAEEKILCDSRSGTTVTFNASGRGYDGTSATSHASGTTNVEHCFTSIEADDANRHIYTSTDDDHTQYARTDGTRAFTGGVTVNGNLTVTGSISNGSGVWVDSYTRIYSTLTSAIAASTTTQVTSNSLDATGDSNSPTYATDALTVKVTGPYLVSLAIAYNPGGGANMTAHLYKNGVSVRKWSNPPSTTTPTTVGGTDVINLTANDVLTYYLENASSSSGGNFAGSASKDATWLSVISL